MIAQECSVVGLDADAKVPYPDFEFCGSNNVRYRGCHTGLDLCGIEDWWVSFVVERYQEDIGNAW